MTARGGAALIGTIPIGALPAGTYRVLDGRLYRVEPGLPPSLDTRDAEIATLRTRAERAEAERDEARALKVPPSVDELNAALMNAAVAKVERDVAIVRAEAAEAEVARLRELHSEERTRIEHASTRALAVRQAAHLFAHAATYSGETVISRILSLLDAAPDAEVSDG